MTSEGPPAQPVHDIAPPVPAYRSAGTRPSSQIAARKRVSQAALAAAVRELRTRRRLGVPRT
jgi:hypothetical protein